MWNNGCWETMHNIANYLKMWNCLMLKIFAWFSKSNAPFLLHMKQDLTYSAIIFKFLNDVVQSTQIFASNKRDFWSSKRDFNFSNLSWLHTSLNGCHMLRVWNTPQCKYELFLRSTLMQGFLQSAVLIEDVGPSFSKIPTHLINKSRPKIGKSSP